MMTCGITMTNHKDQEENGYNNSCIESRKVFSRIAIHNKIRSKARHTKQYGCSAVAVLTIASCSLLYYLEVQGKGKGICQYRAQFHRNKY